jgi:hypothetical protein
MLEDVDHKEVLETLAAAVNAKQAGRLSPEQEVELDEILHTLRDGLAHLLSENL